MNLTEIKEHKSCRIVEIRGGKELIRKLDSLGVRPGVKITKISSHFLKGPVTIHAGCTELALGHGMAKQIIVEG